MISYVKGTLEYIDETEIIIDVNGIGYKLMMSSSAMGRLPSIGREIKIFTYLQVREMEMALYGFITREEQYMFERLISVSGIGPKGALGVLSTLSPGDFYLAVITEDVKTLSSAPGVGKKTAQRIILDLKDKINTIEAVGISEMDSFPLNQNGIEEEAISALTSLGYTRLEASKAVSAVITEDMKVEDIIKVSLKKLAIF
ncbi:MAG: Holliday junction branch migration protein RuvA [Epulopiscium sp.]|nr:Holliday junction branch migration protein RuvA [Candidatus Epulonipiscium sp.]